jgi:hypothetical protein
MIRVGAIQTIGLAEANQVVANRVVMTLAVATAVTSLEATAAAIVKMAPAKTGILQTPASVVTPQAVTEKDSKQEPAAQVDAADPYRP